MNKFKNGYLDRYFLDRQDLLARMREAAVKSPELIDLFTDIGKHVESVRASPATLPLDGLSSKKRKLDTQLENKALKWKEGTFSTFNDISFSIPQRKKLKLEIGTLASQGIRVNNADGQVESFASWSEVSEIACLPVPEKAQAQYNFCVFTTNDRGPVDQLLFTVPDTVPKAGAGTLQKGEDPSHTYKAILLSLFNKGLKTTPSSAKVSEPSKDEFSSQLPQAVRKGETAYHIKAFRGAKEGYLFLLSTGIIWGFKKPLEFYPLHVIESVSYTSVLQRTFNLNLATRLSEGEEVKEWEFSMVDQADFAGIDAYVKRHGLQDASMAEQRRAKKVNVNGVKKGEEEDGDGEGELQKAAREAEGQADDDDDEEDDENFDPGSEGESEGEGSESGEDDADGNAGDDGDEMDDDDDDE